MKLSTATSVLVSYPIHEAAEQVIATGLDGIDLWCGRPHLYRKDHSRQDLHQLRRRLEAASVYPVSLMPAFFRYPFSLSTPNEVARQDSIDYMIDCIENAVVMGANTVLVVPTHSLRGQKTEDARRLFVDSLAQVCAHAERYGVKLGIEVLYPQLSDYMHSTTDALEVIREIGSPSLGVVLDTGHLNLSGEDPERALDNLGDLLFQVHVNDNDAKQQQNAIPGEGCFDFERFLRLLDQRGYQGYLSLELGWTYSFDPLPAICKAAEEVRKYLRQIEM